MVCQLALQYPNLAEGLCRLSNTLRHGNGYVHARGQETDTHKQLDILRNTAANIFVPNNDEWIKAAYHKNNGVTDDYWDYPTRTNADPHSTKPPLKTADSQFNTGNFYADDNIVNGFNNGFAVTGSTTFNPATNYLTDVGA